MPDSRFHHPDPTIDPFLTALATGATFIALIFTPWGLPVGGILLLAALTGWAWPTKREHAKQMKQEAEVLP